MSAPPKTKQDAYTQLQALEAEQAERSDASRAAGKAAREAAERRKLLTAERRRLIIRDPTLVNHREEPVDAGNAVGQIDKEIATAVDPGDAQAKYEHAKRVEAHGREQVREFQRVNVNALLDGFRSEAEAAASRVNLAAEAFIAELDHYIAAVQRGESLVQPSRGSRHPGRNPGMEAAGHLKAAMEGADLPVQLPERQAEPEAVEHD